MFEIAEYNRLIQELKSRTKKAFEKAGIPFADTQTNEDAIRLVFAGQYSAGKSSIVRMLTGSNDPVIGAGITTEKPHAYDWNGISIVDTPGIHTQQRPDHDAASYEAITSADMLVFVVTNELFDSHLADHFRKLAIDKDKAGEMILVVNKMERTAEGNTEEQRNIIRDDLRKVLAPYTPEQLYVCFLDAKSYLESMDEDDQEIADDLVARSGYQEFLSALNRFVADKSYSSRLTTELYVLENEIQTAIERFESKDDDLDIEAVEESLLQQRHVLIDARDRMRQEIKDIFTTGAAKIRNLGADASDLIIDGCNMDDVEAELKKKIQTSDDIIEQCEQEAQLTLENRLNEIGQSMNSIENSEFCNELKIRLNERYDSLPDHVKQTLQKAIPEMQKIGKNVSKSAYKYGTTGGMELTGFTGSKVHDLIIKAGHAMKYKFKPWQAAKIAKGVAIGGTVLEVFGIALSVFLQIKEDQDEDRKNALLRENRQNIRSQFSQEANEFEDYGRKYIKNHIVAALDEPIAELDSSIRELRENKTARNAACSAFEQLDRECQQLIQQIHAI